MSFIKAVRQRVRYWLDPGGFNKKTCSIDGMWNDYFKAAEADIFENPGERSNMSGALFKGYCEKNDLELVTQVAVPWGEIQDCISVFRKRA